LRSFNVRIGGDNVHAAYAATAEWTGDIRLTRGDKLEVKLKQYIICQCGGTEDMNKIENIT
jgi:hypothetical protein